MVILCGCSERAQQKAWLTGGDPALATDADMRALKADVAEIKRSIEQIRVQLEK
jgi:hypothetical protein